MYMTDIINQEEELKRAVMRRVRLIFFLRRFSTPLAVESLLLLILAVAVNVYVSVPHVVLNVSHLSHLNQYLGYIANAAIHTELSVQIILSASVVLAAAVTRDIYKNFFMAGNGEYKMCTSCGL